MKEKPILFNTEMVKSILKGEKTQTRRVIKPQPSADFKWVGWIDDSTVKKNIGCACWGNGLPIPNISHYVKPAYQVGDMLYVRETFCKSQGKYYYKADQQCLGCTEDGRCLPVGVEKHSTCGLCENTCGIIKWKPSIHMPREAARIFLKVTSVKVQRLQEITEEEVKKEGECSFLTFSNLWDKTVNKKDLDKYGWEANPWCFVFSFERVKDYEKH